MADVTVDQLVELAEAPAPGDFFGVWDGSAAQFKKITAQNAGLGAVLGGGTIVTGGFTLTVPKTGTVPVGTGTSGRVAEWTGTNDIAASTLAKSGAGILTLAASGTFTLTVPKTGTVPVGTGTDGRMAVWSGDANTLAASTLIKASAGVLTLDASGTFTLTVPKTGTAVVGTGTTGRIAEWVTDSNTVQASTLIKSGAGVLTLSASGTFTLTVPETLTVAGRNVANTYTALQTFSSGLTFGGSTLSTYTEGTWTPTITGSGSNPTVSYTTQVGEYVRTGKSVTFRLIIVISTISGGSGNLQISMPFNANGNAQGAAVFARGVDFSGTPIGVNMQIQTSGLIGIITTIQDDADRIIEPVSALANGDTISVTGSYIAV